MNVQRFCGALVISALLLARPLTGQAGAVIPGDFDEDGDVDLADFAEFQTCARGPGIPQTDPACADARLDSDEDVDRDDFAVFKGCVSGPNNPSDPSCACPGWGQGSADCGGGCIDVWWDENNCGACGNQCAPQDHCEYGACAWCGEPGPCFGGFLWCDGACRNVGLDPSNCGCCGHICDGGQYCMGGLCWDW